MTSRNRTFYFRVAKSVWQVNISSILLYGSLAKQGYTRDLEQAARDMLVQNRLLWLAPLRVKNFDPPREQQALLARVYFL